MYVNYPLYLCNTQVDSLLRDVLDKSCHNIGITDTGLLGLATFSGMLAF